MKKLRKLELAKYEELTNEEADALRGGGITLTWSWRSDNIGGGITIGNTVTVSGRVYF
jgi:hypothetical protein